MMNNQSTSTLGGKEIPPAQRDMLIAIGRGLGTVSVYGTAHPSIDLVVDQAFEHLKTALKDRANIAIGSYQGALTVDGDPVTIREIPIRTVEKRLVNMNISHLSLHRGLSKEELKNLLIALSAPDDEQMRETLAQDGMKHVEIKDVKYVALGEGEKKVEKGSGAGDSAEVTPAQVSQIVAFLKGSSSDKESSESLKKSLSDPEKLAQMIMEAAVVRQAGVDVSDSESLGDVVIACLRRTYSGLRKEKEFQSVRGKASLAKAMMLLEKNVMDKIHKALGQQHPGIDKRIFDAIREMDEERNFEMLTARYFTQNQKMETARNKAIEAIRTCGPEKAREQFEAAGLPAGDWQQLVVAAEHVASGGGPGEGQCGSGVDLSALAVVLEKLESLMQINSDDIEEVSSSIDATKEGMRDYTDRIESRILELEGQVDLGTDSSLTVEDHAENLSREDLMLEISNLTLALVQPLTVVNASVEAAITHTGKETQKDLLDLAQTSGKRMQKLAKRMMTLVGYPVLESTI